MQEVLINFLFMALRQILNKDLVDKYENELLELVRNELGKAPELLQEGKKLFVCELVSLAGDTTNALTLDAVHLVSSALNVDPASCHATAPTV